MENIHPDGFQPDVQVEASHYRPYSYLNPQRMASIGWQLRLMVDYFPKSSVLEIGGGGGLTKQLLSEEGHHVLSLDIDPELKPEIVGSVTKIPDEANSYDAMLCCQVLEHLPWEASQQGLHELHRVCRLGGVISVPTVRRILSLSVFGPVRQGFRTINGPHFGMARRRDAKEHYWELEAGVSEKAFRQALQEVGFDVVQDFRPSTWFYHHFFVVKKRA